MYVYEIICQIRQIQLLISDCIFLDENVGKMKKKIEYVYSTTRGYRFIFLLLFIFVIGNTLTTLLFPFMIGKIVDSIFYTQNFGLFYTYFFIYFGIYMGNQLINCGLNFCYAHLKSTYLVNIKKNCFEKIQRLKASFFSAINTGDVINRINVDIDKFLDFIHFNLFFSISDALHLLGGISYILCISKLLGVICIIIIPAMYYITKYFTGILTKMNREIEGKRGGLSAWIFEIMTGLTELKLLNANHKMSADYMEYSQEIVNEEISVSYKNIQAQRANVFILLMGQLVFYVVSAYCISSGRMSVGQFVAGCTYFTTCSAYYKNFIGRVSDVVKNMISIERVYEIMLYDEEKEENEGIMAEALKGDIKFSNVKFSYGDTVVLNGIDFEISAGEYVAIVGKSGEGKSTLVNLLCGFYSHDSGKILIDNKNIQEYSLRCLRDRIGVVSQQNLLFEKSVRYNLIFSDESSRDDEIRDVLRKVGLINDIVNEREGLDSTIGVKGRQLSGGQKQRLVIARMLLRKPDILVLDEATSAVDGESETNINDIIQNEYKNNTVISIAHRFSTILRADRIIVLNQGKIIAQGKHEELYGSCDLYRNLYDNARGIEVG